MGLFDDLLGQATEKAAELTGMGQDAADGVSQATEDVSAQAGEHISGITEQLPQTPSDVANQLLGDNNEQK